MRKRIPVFPVDAKLSNGRPGHLSALAFEIKKLGIPGLTKLSEAQKFLPVIMGYRHDQEMRSVASSNSEVMPEPGSVSLADMRAIIAWAAHRKAGMALNEAQKLAADLSLDKLAVYRATKDHLIDKVRASLGSDHPASRIGPVAFDEMWRVRRSSAGVRMLIDAGASPYTYVVKPSPSGPIALNLEGLGQLVENLPSDLSDRLADEPTFAAHPAGKQRVDAYLLHELIEQGYRPVLDAVKAGLRPAGVSIRPLFAKDGEFRGLSLYFEALDSWGARIHFDEGIYEDLSAVLCKRPLFARVCTPSVQGAHQGYAVRKGQLTVFGVDGQEPLGDGVLQSVYTGDAELYTPSYMTDSLSQEIDARINECSLEHLTVPVGRLRLLNKVVQRDERYYREDPFQLDVGPSFQDGRLVDRNVGNTRFCGESYKWGSATLVRDQQWMSEADIPDFLLYETPLVDQPNSLDLSDQLDHRNRPVPPEALEMMSRIRRQIRRSERVASEWLSSEAGALEALEFALSLVNETKLVAYLESSVDGMLAGSGPNTELLKTRAMNRLEEAAGRTEVYDDLPSLPFTSLVVRGWLVCEGGEMSLDKLVNLEGDGPVDLKKPLHVARVSAAITLSSSLHSAGRGLEDLRVMDNSARMIVAHQVLAGALPYAQVFRWLFELQNCIGLTARAEDAAMRINSEVNAALKREGEARRLGLLSVGLPIGIEGSSAHKLSEMLSGQRKLGSASIMAAQSIDDWTNRPS